MNTKLHNGEFLDHLKDKLTLFVDDAVESLNVHDFNSYLAYMNAIHSIVGWKIAQLGNKIDAN